MLQLSFEWSSVQCALLPAMVMHRNVSARRNREHDLCPILHHFRQFCTKCSATDSDDVAAVDVAVDVFVARKMMVFHRTRAPR